MEIDTAIDEIQSFSNTIRNNKKKIIQSAYDECSKIRESISKNAEKIKEGTKKLIEETDPNLTEEGVQKITKKGKIYFRSLKAFNSLLHFIDNKFENFIVPEYSENLTSNDLNQFIRNLSKLLSDINSEQGNTDQIMGLDFMLKKRSIYTPLSKIGSDLTKLRTLQKESYRIIKVLEDLDSLKKDVEDILERLKTTENTLEMLQNEYKSITKIKEEYEKENELLLENPLIKESKHRSVRMTELEIIIGRHLNSFKKIFKKYAREIQRGTISGDFGLVNAAIAYEESPVQRFLQEEDGNPEIKALLEELIKVGKKDLKLKQNHLNNLSQELKLIQAGKLDLEKKEWHEFFKAKELQLKSSEFNTINQELMECDAKLQKTNSDLIMKEEEINLRTKEIDQLSESLFERRTKARELTKEILESSV